MAYTKNDVDQILNDTNYDFHGYVPSKAAINFVNFIKLVNGFYMFIFWLL